MASIPIINLPDDDYDDGPVVSHTCLPSIGEEDDDSDSTQPTSMRAHTKTSLTTVKITSDNILSNGPGHPRRRSIIEIENTTVTQQSFAIVPKPLQDFGGLIVPPVSKRRRISVAQWRDIKSSLFDDSIKFEDATSDDEMRNSPYVITPGLRNIEDTFWDGKRSLIPNYDVMEQLDQIIINVR